MTKSLKVLKLFYALLNEGTLSIDDAKEIIEDNHQHFNKYVKRYVKTIDEFTKEIGGLSITMTEKHISMDRENRLSSEMVYTIILVLIGSKALSKEELMSCMKELINVLSEESKIQIQSFLKRDIETYEPTTMNQDYFDILTQLGKVVRTQKSIEIDYVNTFNEIKTHVILPKQIVFSHHYFYLIGINERGFVTTMRVDRINHCEVTDSRINTDGYDQVSFSNYVSKMRNMYHGERYRVQFQLYGPYTEYVFDEFPDAKVISKDYEKYIYTFEVETLGTGIVYWLLSQGNRVKVLSPKAVVDEYKKELKQMIGYYI
ncbi:helix-turn-helix transcriptional regulator [Macrococcus equi]|uniref:helix-turn-helix transcriptional regulator n=1 Tax=Macrococcus equi TaxID=3395462 RepID=UPI0039BE7B4D